MLSRGTRQRLTVFGVVIGAAFLLVAPLLPADGTVECREQPGRGMTCQRVADQHPLLAPFTALGLTAAGVGLSAAASLRLTDPRSDIGDG